MTAIGLLVVACMHVSSFSSLPRASFQHAGTTFHSGITTKLTAGLYSCSISDANAMVDQDTESVWGSDSNSGRLIRRLVVKRKGVVITVPHSCFSDLSAVHTIVLSSDAKGCVIAITGGDASTGYDARVYIKGLDVIRREVRDGEFPKNFYESTNYTDIPFKD